MKFWVLIISKGGIGANPDKVNALQNISRLKAKDELISFICMMQSNTDIILNFAKEAAVLRKLIKAHTKFEWQDRHQHTFKNLLYKLKRENLLAYYDQNRQTYLFTYAHVTGFGAMLAQGESIKKAKPIAVASRATSKADTCYPQINLEAKRIDFALRRFHNYIIGAPNKDIVVTDHQPLYF